MKNRLLIREFCDFYEQRISTCLISKIHVYGGCCCCVFEYFSYVSHTMIIKAFFVVNVSRLWNQSIVSNRPYSSFLLSAVLSTCSQQNFLSFVNLQITNSRVLKIKNLLKIGRMTQKKEWNQPLVFLCHFWRKKLLKLMIRSLQTMNEIWEHGKPLKISLRLIWMDNGWLSFRCWAVQLLPKGSHILTFSCVSFKKVNCFMNFSCFKKFNGWNELDVLFTYICVFLIKKKGEIGFSCCFKSFREKSEST